MTDVARIYFRGGDAPPSAELDAAFEALLVELKAPGEFSSEALAEAERAAAQTPLPDHDHTDLHFVTIDPPGSLDLDQAMCLVQRGNGFRVYYAIADVPSFVVAGSVLDAETRRRGQTLYAPQRSVPLHPRVLSEGAASLLPGQLRSALVWTIDVDSSGATTKATVQRAKVRSRARFAYDEVQAAFDAGSPPAELALLKPLGELLLAAEEARGGASLRVPDQEIEATADGYVLRHRPLVPVEQWNAQVSLLTGRAAARIMLAGKVGILRTMPPPDQPTIDRLRRQSAALGVPGLLRSATPSGCADSTRAIPWQLALSHESAVLFRGAAYTAFDGELPLQRMQSAVADEYAHVTAPLRRLVDRFGLAICEALCRGGEVPGWARAALTSAPSLSELMAASDHAANALERAGVDLFEALLLQPRVGEVFDGVIVDLKNGKGTAPTGRGLVQLSDPAVLGTVSGALELGAKVRVQLESADPVKRTIDFTVV